MSKIIRGISWLAHTMIIVGGVAFWAIVGWGIIVSYGSRH
jgi:hypothetical protein